MPGVTAPVLVSQMDLQLGLVHELDLLRLLARLRKAPGLLQVQSCSLEMLAADTAPQADKIVFSTATITAEGYHLPDLYNAVNTALELEP